MLARSKWKDDIFSSILNIVISSCPSFFLIFVSVHVFWVLVCKLNLNKLVSNLVYS
jgi:ABC-type dipeptide/oligopeptide/nickel transport system permease component